MPDISIQNETFERLQKHAKPLLDTSDSVVNRALDALEGRGKAIPESDSKIHRRQVDARNLPDLRHTKVLAAKINGQEVVRPNWNRLLERAIFCAKEQLSGIDEIQKICQINLVQGRKEDEGFRFISDLDVSIQGLSANGACSALVDLVSRLGFQFELTFRWRSKKGAASPGELAFLSIGHTV